MTDGPLFSPHWYRVAGLHPRLRGGVAVQRHAHQGEVWWLLEDELTGRQHRIPATTWKVLALMDGSVSVQDVWARALDTLGEDAPSQPEVIQLLADLHQAEVLDVDASPDVTELLSRRRRRRRNSLRQRLLNPVFLRLPLADPDRLLRRLLPWLAPVFSRWFLCLWMLLVVVALALVGMHWSALEHELNAQFLSPGNVVLLWCVFPVLKLLHELGHGLAVRRWGGEVHEFGIMLLVLLPVPYVDASAASAYPDVQRRVVVGAAGVAVELLLAALAVFIWVLVEPGLVRQVALDVMVIGGVSAVLFNGNPLLKFDAYYILTDVAGLPNLATRARAYLGYLGQRLLFGAVVPRPAASVRERRWFVGWGVASFLCRMAILVTIALYLAEQMFVLGVLLAAWTLCTQLVMPLVTGLSSLRKAPWASAARWRGLGVGGGLAGLLAGLLFLLPVPAATVAQGVVWLTDDAVLRVDTNCLVAEVLATPGARVQAGELVARCDDPHLQARVRSLEALVASLGHEYRGHALRDQVRRRVLAEEISRRQGELADARRRAGALLVRSMRDGVLLLPDAADLPGRFLAKGAMLGMVFGDDAARVRVVLDQEQFGRVHGGVQAVELVFADAPGVAHPSAVQRQVPAAGRTLPSAALGVAGGGAIPVVADPTAGSIAAEDVFQLELALPPGIPGERIGGRVWARFTLGTESLADVLARSTRQLLLRRFDV